MTEEELKEKAKELLNHIKPTKCSFDCLLNISLSQAETMLCLESGFFNLFQYNPDFISFLELLKIEMRTITIIVDPTKRKTDTTNVFDYKNHEGIRKEKILTFQRVEHFFQLKEIIQEYFQEQGQTND